MSQAEAAALALSLLAIGASLWTLWSLHRFGQDLAAASADLDDLMASLGEAEKTIGGLHGGR